MKNLIKNIFLNFAIGLLAVVAPVYCFLLLYVTVDQLEHTLGLKTTYAILLVIVVSFGIIYFGYLIRKIFKELT